MDGVVNQTPIPVDSRKFIPGGVKTVHDKIKAAKYVPSPQQPQKVTSVRSAQQMISSGMSVH